MNGAVNGFTYDVAGNVVNDYANAYVYDLEGRICAVAPTNAAGYRVMPGTGYVYDPEGQLSTPRTKTCPREPRLCAVAEAAAQSSVTCGGAARLACGR